MTETNCPNSKTKCPLQNNSIIMTTYDFSMKSVMCYLEWNKRFKKKYVKGVPSSGEGRGGSTTWDGGPNMGVFFLNEPSLTLEVFQGGGNHAQIQSKMEHFSATDRFPLGSLSSYFTSMVVLHFSYLINSTIAVHRACTYIKLEELLG